MNGLFECWNACWRNTAVLHEYWSSALRWRVAADYHQTTEWAVGWGLLTLECSVYDLNSRLRNRIEDCPMRSQITRLCCEILTWVRSKGNIYPVWQRDAWYKISNENTRIHTRLLSARMINARPTRLRSRFESEAANYPRRYIDNWQLCSCLCPFVGKITIPAHRPLCCYYSVSHWKNGPRHRHRGWQCWMENKAE